MNRPLAGLAVVVTRPARQAEHFMQLLREQDATTVAFPALAIEPVTLVAAGSPALSLEDFDWVVYTSANAVHESLAQLGRPVKPSVAAIGPATARALEALGIQAKATPASGADSEGLLTHPALADPLGWRILIVKGAGGRDALRAELATRGAVVTTAEVYRRVRPAPSFEALAELDRARAAELVVVAVTSVDVLDALLALAPERRYRWLRDAPLLVPGKRVAAEARAREWRGPLVVAGSAEDETMVEALIEWSCTGVSRDDDG